MSAITVFQRTEKKYLLEEAVMNRLLPVIEEHMEPDRYCLNGKTYSICNLYFDTEGFDVIRESLSHPFYKEKLRMRSYGIPWFPHSKVFLEMKKKINGTVTKRRAELTRQEAEIFLEKRELPERASYMTTQVLREIDYYLSHKPVKPSMRISYERRAYFDRVDRQFRVTFDRDIRYLMGEVSLSGYRNGKRLLSPSFRLMEVKVSGAYPLWFSHLLSENHIGVSSFSKYGTAYKAYLKEEVLDYGDNLNILSHI